MYLERSLEEGFPCLLRVSLAELLVTLLPILLLVRLPAVASETLAAPAAQHERRLVIILLPPHCAAREGAALGRI